MSERARPTDNTGAMDVARAVTDNRDGFTVYLDVARKLVNATLGPEVAKLAIAATHRLQLIEAEAYSIAQPAHLSDAAANESSRLLSMLDDLGVFGAQGAES